MTSTRTTNIVTEVRQRDTAANFIDGAWQPTEGATENSTDPATGEAIGVAPSATEEEVDAAVAAAVRAAPGWADTPGPTRGALLREVAARLEAERDALAELMTAEMGKPIRESNAEIGRALGELDYAAGEGTRLEGATIPSARPGLLVYTTREPVGVVGAITPWNFPLIAPVRKLAPALVCGNPVVLKPARETPLIALTLAAMIKDAGAPDGVVNVVCGRGSTVGTRLMDHPDVAAISFTGSTAVGRQVGSVVGRRLGGVQLELGGKNAAYVHSTGNLSVVVDEIVNAALQTTGQRCTSISRVLVENDLADELVSALAGAFDGLKVGPGADPSTDIGPLVSSGHLDNVSKYVDIGIDEGARVVTSGRDDLPNGPYMAPVVLDQVRPDMRVAQEEIFGPVLSVLRVDGVDDAVAAANHCEYGLTSSVFSRDLDVAMRFIRGVQAGMVHVNHGTNSEPHVPFGGVAESGVGPYSIGYTVKDFFTKTKVAYVRSSVG